jgi:hypothetical protein
VLFARRRQRFLLWYSIALLVLIPPAAVLGALWSGPLGVVIVSTPVYCITMTFMAKEALAELNGQFSEICLQTWPIFAATTTMAASVLLAREFSSQGLAHSPWSALMFLSMVGAISYGATLFVIGRPIIAEVSEVVTWVLKRPSAER